MDAYCSGKQSKAQVLEQLMEAVDMNADGVISAEEFKDFYTNVSPNFTHDEQFQKHLHNSWDLY